MVGDTKQVTIKVWSDTRATLNRIKEITRESLVLIIHRLAADELARLKNLRERTRATWGQVPTSEADIAQEVYAAARCESRCPRQTPWSMQAWAASGILSAMRVMTRCVLTAGHEGDHLGPDESSWPQEEADATEIGEEWTYSTEYQD